MLGNGAIIRSIGQNAAAWTDAFIAAGFTVRNLVRFPERLPKHPGRQYARLDLDDSSTFQSALKGIHALGLITPSHPDQVKREICIINPAKRAGGRHISKLPVSRPASVCPLSPFPRSPPNTHEVLATPHN